MVLFMGFCQWIKIDPGLIEQKAGTGLPSARHVLLFNHEKDQSHDWSLLRGATRI